MAILAEDHREVLAALAELPPRRREAIVLRYWLDLSEREIATAMGVSAGTVKSHVSRGLAELAQVLGGQGMNTIEDRLRDALRERAAHSPIDPDAWARTVARSRRRPGRAPGWSKFMIPLAAAAAVVAIVAVDHPR